MKVHVYGSFVPADQLVPLAVEAEALGFAGLNVPDHIVHPLEMSSDHPVGDDDAALPWDEDQDWPDPFVISSAIAASTEELEVVTAVVVLGLRHPLAVAKSITTLDVVAGGRFSLGIGVGWLGEEFAAVDQQFARRGRRVEEMIEIIRAVQGPEPVAHSGEFYEFGRLTVRPRPASPVPILIGGGSRPARRRAALLGDGFLPPPSLTPEIASHVAEIREIRAEAGLADEPYRIIPGVHGKMTADDFDELRELGIETVYADPFGMASAAYDPGSVDYPNPGEMTLDQRRAALEAYRRDVLDAIA
jgi:probable F420-dependent oxidoreductase